MKHSVLQVKIWHSDDEDDYNSQNDDSCDKDHLDKSDLEQLV